MDDELELRENYLGKAELFKKARANLDKIVNEKIEYIKQFGR